MPLPILAPQQLCLRLLNPILCSIIVDTRIAQWIFPKHLWKVSNLYFALLTKKFPFSCYYLRELLLWEFSSILCVHVSASDIFKIKLFIIDVYSFDNYEQNIFMKNILERFNFISKVSFLSQPVSLLTPVSLMVTLTLP